MKSREVTSPSLQIFHSILIGHHYLLKILPNSKSYISKSWIDMIFGFNLVSLFFYAYLTSTVCINWYGFSSVLAKKDICKGAALCRNSNPPYQSDPVWMQYGFPFDDKSAGMRKHDSTGAGGAFKIQCTCDVVFDSFQQNPLSNPFLKITDSCDADLKRVLLSQGWFHFGLKRFHHHQNIIIISLLCQRLKTPRIWGSCQQVIVLNLLLLLSVNTPAICC